jgi:hypothetical protein
MGLPDRQELRVGDQERQAVVDQLRTHLGDGRLELHEFEDRTAKALAARTVADLVPLTADLPVVRTSTKGPPIRHPDRRPAQGWELAWRIHRGVWGVLSAFFVLIWLLTTPTGYFWPIWPILGIGVSVGIHGAVKKAAEG